MEGRAGRSSHLPQSCTGLPNMGTKTGGPRLYTLARLIRPQSSSRRSRAGNSPWVEGLCSKTGCWPQHCSHGLRRHAMLNMRRVEKSEG